MTAVTHQAAHERLAHFPVTFFATVMGLSGLSIAAHKAARVAGLFEPVSLLALAAAGAAFVAIAVLYGLKAARHPHAVAAEFSQPVRLHFAPAISIGLLLLSIATAPFLPGLSFLLFVLAAPLHLAFTLFVVDRWFNRDIFQLSHVNAAWFIPIVGNVVAPIAAVRHGYAEIGWFFFAVGIVFWLPMLALVLQRKIMMPPLPDRLKPTAAILIAPPSVAFLSYVALTDALDPFARTLYYFGVLMFAIVLVQAPRLMRLPFFLSWWAYSFPLAAITLATLTMAERAGGWLFQTFGLVLAGATTLVIAGLVARTGIAIWKGEICQPE